VRMYVVNSLATIAGQTRGAMHADHGLARAGASRDPSGPVEAAIYEPPLVGVQEDHPVLEVIAFMSTNHIDPDLAAELFILEPLAGSASDGSISDASSPAAAYSRPPRAGAMRPRRFASAAGAAGPVEVPAGPTSSSNPTHVRRIPTRASSPPGVSCGPPTGACSAPAAPRPRQRA